MAKEKTEKKTEKKKKGPSQQEIVAEAMKKQGKDFSVKAFSEKSGIPYANVAWYKWNITTNDGIRPPREKKVVTEKTTKKAKK
jgi:hypothetical protein